METIRNDVLGVKRELIADEARDANRDAAIESKLDVLQQEVC
jgi:hypothetical protein